MCKANVILLIYRPNLQTNFIVTQLTSSSGFQLFQEPPSESGKANGKYFSSLSGDLVSRIQRHSHVVIFLLEDLNLKQLPLTIKSLR